MTLTKRFIEGALVFGVSLLLTRIPATDTRVISLGMTWTFTNKLNCFWEIVLFFSLDSSRVDFDRDTSKLVDSLHVEYLSKVRHALRFEYYFTIVFDDGNTVSMVVWKFLVQCLIDEQTDKMFLHVKLYLVIWEQEGVANMYIKVWIKQSSNKYGEKKMID